MSLDINVLSIVKHVVAVIVLVCIILAPAYLAAMNERDKYEKLRIRCSLLLFGWLFIGWLVALFFASRK
jgi:hypothetical protein